jgi:alpha-tubulin suppressor-like RCC1 family protein
VPTLLVAGHGHMILSLHGRANSRLPCGRRGREWTGEPPGIAAAHGRELLGAASRTRLLLPVLFAAAALLLAAGPPAQARARRISLSLPSSADTGARVLATGRVAGVGRGRRVFVQALHGRRWRTLGSATVSRAKFKVVFVAPNLPGLLIVRAVLYRHRHRLDISRLRRLVIRARRATPPLAPAIAIGAMAITGWGENDHGELGGGYKSAASPVPVPVLGLHGIKAVAATYYTSYALLNDGTVRSWGGDVFGQLGVGVRELYSSQPVTVAGLTGVTAIAAGGAHAMALLNNGTVATWGGNSYGQMGNGTTLKGAEGAGSLVPVIVPNLSGVVAIAAGGGDDVALLSNGTVVAWGENRQGQLGDGTTLEKDVPTPVHGLAGVKAVAVGGITSLGGHMLALLNDGTVRAIGKNDSGELGNGGTASSASPVIVSGLTGVTAVSAAVSHSMARLENGTVVSWGNNSYGELGVGPGPEICGKEPVPCSRVPVRVGVTNVTAISAGFRFSLALSAGKVFAWGWNELGQLGNGTTANSSVPVPVIGLSDVVEVAAGEKHSLALLNTGGPSLVIELVAGVGSLTVSWKAGEGTEPWRISWRPVAHPTVEWAPYVSLPPATRSYTIGGLSAKPYQVILRSKTFGTKILTGTPLG